jgi:hypothetical protein
MFCVKYIYNVLVRVSPTIQEKISVIYVSDYIVDKFYLYWFYFIHACAFHIKLR